MKYLRFIDTILFINFYIVIASLFGYMLDIALIKERREKAIKWILGNYKKVLKKLSFAFLSLVIFIFTSDFIKEIKINTIVVDKTEKYQVERILGSPPYLESNGLYCEIILPEMDLRGNHGLCFEKYPESKYIFECFYHGNASLLFGSLEDSIEIIYNDQGIVCAPMYRYGL